jgi:4-amino-4-deoxy-L-arabinose transferase-like glycosyltransferase
MGWRLLILAGILILGGWARLGSLDLGWFMMDQARDAVQALRIVEEKHFPLVGPIARGIYALGPLYYYLLAVPFSFSRDPSGAVLFTGMLNLVGVYLTYRLGREFFSPTAGLVAAALYAVFPMAVVSSSAMWNPGFVPLFAVVFFYSLYQFAVAERPWGLTVALVALGCLLQVHLSGLALPLLLVAVFALLKPPIPWRHAVLGLALVFLLFTPYLVFEARRNFQGISDALRFLEADRAVGVGEPWVTISWRALTAPFTIPARMADAMSLDGRRLLFGPAQYVEMALVLAGLLCLLGWTMSRWRRSGEIPRSEVLLILWIVVPLVALAQKKQVLMWYYFDLLYPSQFLLIGILVDGMTRRMGGEPAKRLATAVGVSAAVLIVGAQALFLGSLRRDILNEGYVRLPTEIGLRFPDPLWQIREKGILELMPVRYKRELTAAILADSSVDRDAFYQRAHGSAFEDLAEDRGYFLMALRRAAAGGPGEAHYALVRERDWPGGIEGVSRKVGPFLVARYEPLVRYAFWRYSSAPGPDWFSGSFDDSSWALARLPARNPPDLSEYAQTPPTSWERAPVYYRGWIVARGAVEGLTLVVSLRDLPLPEQRHRIAGLYVNGRRLEPVWARSYLTALTRSTEVAFSIGHLLEPRPNLVAFEVNGASPWFDIDVYEVRWKGHGQG